MKDLSYIKKELFSWARYIIGAFVFAVIVNSAVLVNAQVISPSMENTIMTGDKLLGFRLSYLFGDPKRYDVIVFKFPDNEESYPFVKRIIALPNEKVEIKNGKVFINDSKSPLEDSFVKGIPHGNYGPFYVPENAYFVLGDNRNDSNDSKDWTNKFVFRNKILGKACFLWYPRFGLLGYEASDMS